MLPIIFSFMNLFEKKRTLYVCLLKPIIFKRNTVSTYFCSLSFVLFKNKIFWVSPVFRWFLAKFYSFEIILLIKMRNKDFLKHENLQIKKSRFLTKNWCCSCSQCGQIKKDSKWKERKRWIKKQAFCIIC